MSIAINTPGFVNFVLDVNANNGKVYYSETLNTIVKILTFDNNESYSESIYGNDYISDLKLYKKNLKLVELGKL